MKLQASGVLLNTWVYVEKQIISFVFQPNAAGSTSQKTQARTSYELDSRPQGGLETADIQSSSCLGFRVIAKHTRTGIYKLHQDCALVSCASEACDVA